MEEISACVHSASEDRKASAQSELQKHNQTKRNTKSLEDAGYTMITLDTEEIILSSYVMDSDTSPYQYLFTAVTVY